MAQFFLLLPWHVGCFGHAVIVGSYREPVLIDHARPGVVRLCGGNARRS
jgi:hypothetical protein